MVALGGMEKEELRGLDIAIFSRAPPEAMLATLQHLRCALPWACLIRLLPVSELQARLRMCAVEGDQHCASGETLMGLLCSGPPWANRSAAVQVPCSAVLRGVSST